MKEKRLSRVFYITGCLSGMKKYILIIVISLCLGASSLAQAETVGEKRVFFVDQNHDATAREKVTAVLVKVTSKVYFYADESWWNFTSQSEAHTAINALGAEFDSTIYPVLTSKFGQEASPGIDGDRNITILIHQMKEDSGGYFRSNDEYSKLQVTDSNEREMIYINANSIKSSIAKSLVAHEFTHLITFNQKNNIYGAQEEDWLNEARAEYAPTLLGYNDVYNGSYLEKRVQYFSEKPIGSIVDWQNTKHDYGRASLLVHYLVDHYGINILVDSLHSPKTGVESINYALQKNNNQEGFYQVFSDWVAAVLLNDCDYGKRYCYLDKNLKDFYLSASINFLPLTGTTTLTFADNTKLWSGNWYKIIGGGGGTLKFYFEGDAKASFKVPYITRSQSGAYAVNILSLDKLQRGEVVIKNFGKDVASLFVLPLLQNTITADTNSHSFFWSVSITREQEGATEIQRLQAIIEDLKQKIAAIKAGLPLPQTPPVVSGSAVCPALNSNLYFGLSNNAQVSCLQQFLKSQGFGIYPEGLITGNFGNLTKNAVIRFQEKYKNDILGPVGLTQGTGFVGAMTRAKINALPKIN